MHEQDWLQIDSTYEPPPEIVIATSDPSHWQLFKPAHYKFDNICNCIGLVESDRSTMSNTYTAVLVVCMHIHNFERVAEIKTKQVDSILTCNWKKIYLSVYSLSYLCDPLFCVPWHHASDTCISYFVDLGHNVILNCHVAIKMLQDDEEHEDLLMHEYMYFCVMPEKQNPKLCMWYPELAWGKLEREYPNQGSVQRV